MNKKKVSKKKKDGSISKQGEGGGAKFKYKDESSLLNVVVKYIKTCEKKQEMPNKAGFCARAKISRSTYNDYKKVYKETIRAFEVIVEDAWVQRLGKHAATGAIFYLKNAFKENYKDRYEQDHKHKFKGVTKEQLIEEIIGDIADDKGETSGTQGKGK